MKYPCARLLAGPVLLALGTCLVGALPASAQEDETCFVCHGDASVFEGMEDPSRMVVTAESIAESVHGAVGLSCVHCHQELADFDDFPHPDRLGRVDCGVCHDDVQATYSESLHGYALQRGNPRAPDCSSCHGTHDILPSSDPRSRAHKVRLPATCAKCHGTAGLLTDQIVKLPQSFTDYARSVHGRGAERGIAVAASCADCHGVHDLRGPADPKSKINTMNVAATCGACHPDIQLEYDKSIHGRALKAGITDSPTCTGCHGEHLILSPRDARSKTEASKLAHETCGSCHDDPVIIAKYNLQGGVVGSYVDSYHGWATRRHYSRAATCVSCHTAHSVLPESHPDSTISPGKVVETCRTCHPKADRRFAASYTHETASTEANPINRIIRNVYIVMILVVIGAMVLHNLVIMNYFMIRRRREVESSRWILRFDGAQIAQHLLLTISFVVLAVTGFALRFPEAWWVEYLTLIGMTEPVRANVHRIFGVVLIAVSLSHVYYVFLTRRGKHEFRSILPSWRDVKDLVDNLRYYTWRTNKPARFGRYDYSQKAEYWALIWGTILMIVTGFVLWFPEQAVRIFPIWIVSASQTVHYYEAWLATLAIIVWHFFFVIFHPEEYPMSWTWLTGKMSERAVRHHHARWYDEEIAGEPEAGKPEREPEAPETRPAAPREVAGS